MTQISHQKFTPEFLQHPTVLPQAEKACLEVSAYELQRIAIYDTKTYARM